MTRVLDFVGYGVSATFIDIVAETEHMSRLASNLLALARLDASALPMEREIVDLSRVAAGLVRRVGALGGTKGVAIQEIYGEAALAYGDALAVEQAALILVENAIKYTPSGGTVTLRTATRDGSVSLTVEDTGMGIASEHRGHLGQRFYRADRSRSRETGGAGLGLAIASRIATAHGGSLAIESTPGQGTRVTLRLPSAPL